MSVNRTAARILRDAVAGMRGTVNGLASQVNPSGDRDLRCEVDVDRARLEVGGDPTAEQRTGTSTSEGVVDVSKVRGRHRRPTGAPPPLPKKIGATGVLRLALVVLVVIPGCIWLHYDPGPLDRFDAASPTPWSRCGRGGSTPWPTPSTRRRRGTGSGHDAAHRRRRGVVPAVAAPHPVPDQRGGHGGAGGGLLLIASRPRPFDVTMIGSWEGFSAPSLPMGGLAVVIAGIVYMLVPPGRPRMIGEERRRGRGDRGRAAADLPRGRPLHRRVFGAILGVSIPVAVFRALAPNDVYPGQYGARGSRRTSTSRAGVARRSSWRMTEQLGYRVLT